MVAVCLQSGGEGSRSAKISRQLIDLIDTHSRSIVFLLLVRSLTFFRVKCFKVFSGLLKKKSQFHKMKYFPAREMKCENLKCFNSFKLCYPGKATNVHDQ